MRALWLAMIGLVVSVAALAVPAAAQQPGPMQYQIEGTNSCLASVGDEAVFVACDNSSEQKWERASRPEVPGGFFFVNAASGRCLSADYSGAVCVLDCTGQFPFTIWEMTSDQKLALGTMPDMKMPFGDRATCLDTILDKTLKLAPCEDLGPAKLLAKVDRTRLGPVLTREIAARTRQFTLNEIRNGTDCLTRFEDQKRGKDLIRFEACYSGGAPVPAGQDVHDQLWVFTQSTSPIMDTRDPGARIMNARMGGCITLEGRVLVVKKCDDGVKVGQWFTAYFRSLQLEIGSDTYCLRAGPGGSVGYGMESRGQCKPHDIWNNESFKFASTGIPFKDWTPPPVQKPPLGVAKSIQWIRVTCKKPATGVSDGVYTALAVAEWAMVVRSGPLEVAKTLSQDIVMSEVENQFGVNPLEATSPAYLLKKMDGLFSSTDDLYLQINNSVVWPEYFDDPRQQVKLGYTPHGELSAGRSVELFNKSPQYRIDLAPGERVRFSAWEWDDASDNDKMAEIELNANIAPGKHTFLLMSKSEHSVYEFEFNVTEQPFWSCSGNIRKCDFTPPPLPAWPVGA